MENSQGSSTPLCFCFSVCLGFLRGPFTPQIAFHNGLYHSNRKKTKNTVPKRHLKVPWSGVSLVKQEIIWVPIKSCNKYTLQEGTTSTLHSSLQISTQILPQCFSWEQKDSIRFPMTNQKIHLVCMFLQLDCPFVLAPTLKKVQGQLICKTLTSWVWLIYYIFYPITLSYLIKWCLPEASAFDVLPCCS